MAKYELKRMDDGKWRIWARHTAFKGAPVKSHVSLTNRDGIAKAIGEAHAWVEDQRKINQE